MSSLRPVIMEFHISRQARELYQFDQSLFSFSGNVIFANFHAARVFAQKMNAGRDLVTFPERAVRAGQINAMGLIDEILHLVAQQYRQQRNPPALELAYAWLVDQIGQAAVEKALHQFINDFPPLAVYRNEINLEAYLGGFSVREDGSTVPNRQIVLEEMLMLWLANLNPAFAPFLELFDDEALEKNTAYKPMMTSLHDFFETQPRFGPENQNLIDMLRAPALASPNSLTGQLEFIRSRWGVLLGSYLFRLLSSLDLVKEEERPVFGVGGQGLSYVYEFAGLTFEPERFSRDRDWMPNLVLMAKNIYVWLDQLSRKYQRLINRLDQIPDQELDTLRRWGITGLWLIGLWERSSASKTIKQLRGNPEAVASAYSLFSYDIAAELGGEEAYQVLRDKCWRRGIRLASDMVPNHMGIDSRWVIEHPDWFISLNYSPFPTYSFNGQNLSWDNRVGLFIEDHYFNNTDAAVVFKRYDYWTGNEKYIYHGNDGTSMPWNDTAQLNYLLPEVREAVIQTILHVARKFPIIRFDAAMTLAKKHYQRLWYPEPGSGGDIPSRSEHGLNKAQFDQAMPEEFWREVVDRVAQEAPDTLLLAEAFWLMEGYFVRTLGMHRVYNSAFMNMLRDEKNQEYRLVIKNTLEFDPEILKRYVNFMNNPDERTAVDQFGKDDKYFGVCTMLATLPGLPMFGHGQVEGFTEKYGMEYKQAYYQETPDGYLVERHERQIFPLLRRRYVFAEATNFLLYDFYTPEGYVNEDVFAYSNRAGMEAGLVIYHNKFATAHGWVRVSAAYPVKTGQGDEKILVQKTLGEGLGLHRDPSYYAIFRDHVSGLEFLRNCQELHEKGLYVELQAYKVHVFLDFREVQDDTTHRYAQLAGYLQGGGVQSIDETLKEIYLQPVLTPFRELINAGMLTWLIEHRAATKVKTLHTVSLPQALDEVERKAKALLVETRRMALKEDGKKDIGIEDVTAGAEIIAAEIRKTLEVMLKLPGLKSSGSREKAALAYLQNGPDGKTPLENGDPVIWGTLFAWLFISWMSKVLAPGDVSVNGNAERQSLVNHSRTWMDEWLLGKNMAKALQEMGLSEQAAVQQVNLARILTSHSDWYDPEANPDKQAHQALQAWLEDPEVQRYLMIHRYEGILWFNKEAFETLLWWLYTTALVKEAAGEQPLKAPVKPSLAAKEIYAVIQALLKVEEKSGYQVERLREPI